MAFLSPLATVLVEAGGFQCGVCHRGERGFRIRQLPVNFSFVMSGGTVGGVPCGALSAFIVVGLGEHLRQQPGSHVL
jgi:hypothetical protein